jgi:NADH:ubiquinone oxidoreductase subunit 5 (subunit L)/multisubunit Na+/H+ antiporter MnhA subunit
VYQKTHTRNIEELGGLSKKMKATAYLFFCGALAISAMPFFAGFISEFLIYIGIISGAKTSGPVLFAAAIMTAGAISLTGGLAIIAFTRLYSVIFSGSSRSQKTAAASETNGLSLAAMYFLAFLCFAGGILPQYFFKAVSAPVAYLLNGAHTADAFAVIQGLLKSISLILVSGMFIIAAVYLLRKFSLRGKTDESLGTWGCGYQKSSPRVQYTADSFSEPLSAVSRAVTGKNEEIEEPAGILPEKASYKSGLSDVIETFITVWVKRFTGRFFGSFANVQSGNMQHYILYGLVFLLAAFIYAMAVK